MSKIVVVEMPKTKMKQFVTFISDTFPKAIVDTTDGLVVTNVPKTKLKMVQTWISDNTKKASMEVFDEPKVAKAKAETKTETKAAKAEPEVKKKGKGKKVDDSPSKYDGNAPATDAFVTAVAKECKRSAALITSRMRDWGIKTPNQALSHSYVPYDVKDAIRKVLAQ